MARNSKKSRNTRKLRNAIWYRTFGPVILVKCHWCPKLISFNESTLDHEPPLAEGGTWLQAVLACNDCNQRRGIETFYRLKRNVMKNKIKQYFDLEAEIHEYFGYKEDWVTIPLDERLNDYWFITSEGPGGHYCHSKKPITKELIADGSEIYGGPIYTQRHLPKWVYRTDDLTMVSANTQCDGNRYLIIFDNKKECKDEAILKLYEERYGSGLDKLIQEKYPGIDVDDWRRGQDDGLKKFGFCPQ